MNIPFHVWRWGCGWVVRKRGDGRTPPISVGGAENVRDSRGNNAKFNFLSIRLRIMCDLWTVKHLQVRKQIRKCTTTTSHFSKWISHIRNYIRWSRAAATRDWACRSLATPSRLASDPLTIHSSSSSTRFVAEQSTNSTQFNSLKAPLLLHIATTTHTNIHASSINSPLCCAKFDYNHSSGHILFKSMM